MEVILIKVGQYFSLNHCIKLLQIREKYCYAKVIRENLYLLISDLEVESKDVIHNIEIRI